MSKESRMRRLLNRLLGRAGDGTRLTNATEHSVKADQLIAEGNAFEDSGQLVKAELRYQQALRLRPDFAKAWLNLGNVQLAQQQPYQAAASYREALRREPGYGAAHANLGRLYLSWKDPQNAAEHYAAAVQALPDSADAFFGWGSALEDMHRYNEAIDTYRQALAIQPGFIAAKQKLIDVLMVIKCLDEAAQHLRDILVNSPDDANGHVKLASVLAQQDCVSEAKTHLLQAWTLQPNCALHLVSAYLLLPKIPESIDAIAYWRQRYQDGIKEFHSRPGVSGLDGGILTISFNLAYHGQNNRSIMESLCRCFRHKFPILTFTAPHLSVWKAPSIRNQRIRVGFLSELFRDHTIGVVFQGFIRHLDRSRFEVLLIHTSETGQHDEFRQNLDALVNKVVTLPSDSLDVQQQVIAAEQLDVLFYPDIGMFPLSYFLAFARLAPVQAVSWGHPDTTGLDTMDYYVSAASFEPTDAEDHYSERLIRLNRLPCFYKPQTTPTQIPSRTDFGLPETGALYGCPQSLFKIHPEFDSILAEIAEGDPTGLIVMPQGSVPALTDRLKARWAKTFPILLERILFMPWLPLDRFMMLLARIDVLLDPIHFGSGNTMYQAMVYGTPIVTWPGRFARGRTVAAAYQQMGVTDAPVVDRLEDYASLALALGRDRERRETLRQHTVAAGNALFADMQAVRELEAFFEAAVATAGRGEKLPPGWQPKASAALLQQDSPI